MCSEEYVLNFSGCIHPKPEQRFPRLIKNSRLVSSAVNHRCSTARTTNCHIDCGKSLNGIPRMKIHKADVFHHSTFLVKTKQPHHSWVDIFLSWLPGVCCSVKCHRFENKDYPRDFIRLAVFFFKHFFWRKPDISASVNTVGGRKLVETWLPLHPVI